MGPVRVIPMAVACLHGRICGGGSVVTQPDKPMLVATQLTERNEVCNCLFAALGEVEACGPVGTFYLGKSTIHARRQRQGLPPSWQRVKQHVGFWHVAVVAVSLSQDVMLQCEEWMVADISDSDYHELLANPAAYSPGRRTSAGDASFIYVLVHFV
eukprot:gene882-590_t